MVGVLFVSKDHLGAAGEKIGRYLHPKTERERERLTYMFKITMKNNKKKLKKLKKMMIERDIGRERERDVPYPERSLRTCSLSLSLSATSRDFRSYSPLFFPPKTRFSKKLEEKKITKFLQISIARISSCRFQAVSLSLRWREREGRGGERCL